MNFTDALQAEIDKSNNTICKIGKIITEMDDSDAKALTEALQARDSRGTFTYPDRMIERAMRAAGTPVADSTIFKHRRGECRCA